MVTSPRALASLFDAASHIQPVVPSQLLVAWSASARDEATAEALMAEYACEGTCMLGDASGLSRLSRELSLLDVLAMLHKPKTMTVSAARACGGEAITGWTADNTAIWFGANVPTGRVAACTQALVASFAELPFQMSFGLHHGRFFKIGNTVMGPAFTALEHCAENDVPAGHIWASSDFCARLGMTGTPVAQLPGLTMLDIPVKGHPAMTFSDSHDPYPHAFDNAFFRMLDMYARADATSAEALRLTLEEHAGKSGYILFFAYSLPHSTGLAAALDQQMQDVVLRSGFTGISLPADVRWIKHGGGIGILRGDNLQSLVAAANSITKVCQREQVPVAFGVDRGDYFLFALEGGEYDVAGSPVNIASKLSEDCGKPGSILVSESAWEGGSAQEHILEISGMRLIARELQLLSV